MHLANKSEGGGGGAELALQLITKEDEIISACIKYLLSI
jgi:hypothetical protein